MLFRSLPYTLLRKIKILGGRCNVAPPLTTGGGTSGHGSVGLGHRKGRCQSGRARVCHGDSVAARIQRDEKRELIGCDSV